MIKVKIVKIIKAMKTIQLLESIVLLGNRATLLVLLTTVCLSVSNVFATGTGDISLEAKSAPDGLARALQTTKVNSANPTIERNLRANGINESARVNTTAITKEKIPQIENITKMPTNKAINNLGNNVDLINTPQYNEADLNILPTVNPNEKSNPRQGNDSDGGSKEVNESHVMQDQRKETQVTPEIAEITEISGASKVVEAKSEVDVNDVSASTNSDSLAKSDLDKNPPQGKSEFASETKKSTKQEVQEVQEEQTVKEAKPVINKIKKTKLTRATKPKKPIKPKKRQSSTNKPLVKDADAVDEGLDEQYSTESFSQELENSLSSGNSSNNVGEILFAENEQIRVSLSNRDVNRLSITNDKIQSINGPTGSYTAKNDPLGSAYIGVNTDKRFTLFASTVKGHQFSLFVAPIASAGKTVVLTPSMPSRMTAKWEVTEGYQKIIVSLISSMINNEPLQDYAYVPVKKSQKTYNFYGVAQIKPIGYYLGANFVGSVSVIKNTTKKPLSIKPSSLYIQGVRAIAISEQTLAPKGLGLVYQVVSK